MADTIAAVATPLGRGGIGVIRVSGPLTLDIAKMVLPKIPEPRRAEYLPFKFSGNLIDSGIAIYFPSPNSYTGEDVLELQAHGGPAVMDLLLDAVFNAGARPARPGEFTERAYLNNKMDLAQAEAVASLIAANTKHAALAASRTLSGAFSRQINSITENLIQLRMYVEAALDFPEEELDFMAEQHIKEALSSLVARLDSLLKKAEQGVLLDGGVKTALVGRPNAGKSSLLNCLARDDVAIVSAIAGTTRDSIKQSINLEGLELLLIDTAGIRDAADEVELLGIAKSQKAIQSADLILLVVDLSDNNLLQDIEVWKKEFQNVSAKVVLVANKLDLKKDKTFIPSVWPMVEVSVSQEKNIDSLVDTIKETIGFGEDVGSDITARKRHVMALNKVVKSILRGKDDFYSSFALELLAEELKTAQLQLNEVTGEFTSDDLLGKIFSEFCIGK